MFLSVSKLQLTVDEDGKQTKIAHSMVAKDGEVVTHILISNLGFSFPCQLRSQVMPNIHQLYINQFFSISKELSNCVFVIVGTSKLFLRQLEF